MIARGASGRDGKRPSGWPELTTRVWVVVHDLQVAFDQEVLHPVLADLARLAVGDQFVGVEGDVEVEVVVDHHLHGLRLGDAADVAVDGLAGDLSGRPVAVAVDPAAGSELLEKLGRDDFVVFGGHVAQGVRERDHRVVAVERVAAVGCAPDPGLELLRFGKFGQLDSQNWLGHRNLRSVIVARSWLRFRGFELNRASDALPVRTPSTLLARSLVPTGMLERPTT